MHDLAVWIQKQGVPALIDFFAEYREGLGWVCLLLAGGALLANVFIVLRMKTNREGVPRQGNTLEFLSLKLMPVALGRLILLAQTLGACALFVAGLAFLGKIPVPSAQQTLE